MRVLIGQLHPLLVHFPIALALLAAGVLVCTLLRPSERWRTAVRLLIHSSAAGALLATAAGWVLAGQNFFAGREAQLFDLHSLGGYGVTVALVTASLLQLGSGQRAEGGTGGARVMASHMLVVLAAIGVSGVGYLGGELVHGENHLVTGFIVPEAEIDPGLGDLTPPSEVGAVSSDGQLVFRRDVRPVLKKSCFKCHSAKKVEGGLRLDQRNLAMQGGDSGPAFVPGDAATSLIIERIRLPRDHEDYMPTKGDPLTPEQVAMLETWVNGGASYY